MRNLEIEIGDLVKKCHRNTIEGLSLRESLLLSTRSMFPVVCWDPYDILQRCCVVQRFHSCLSFSILFKKKVESKRKGGWEIERFCFLWNNANPCRSDQRRYKVFLHWHTPSRCQWSCRNRSPSRLWGGDHPPRFARVCISCLHRKGRNSAWVGSSWWPWWGQTLTPLITVVKNENSSCLWRCEGTTMWITLSFFWEPRFKKREWRESNPSRLPTIQHFVGRIVNRSMHPVSTECLIKQHAVSY